MIYVSNSSFFFENKIGFGISSEIISWDEATKLLENEYQFITSKKISPKFEDILLIIWQCSNGTKIFQRQTIIEGIIIPKIILSDKKLNRFEKIKKIMKIWSELLICLKSFGWHETCKLCHKKIPEISQNEAFDFLQERMFKPYFYKP